MRMYRESPILNTGTGVALGNGTPLPSDPFSAAPQQYTALSEAIPHVCDLPALIASHRS